MDHKGSTWELLSYHSPKYLELWHMSHIAESTKTLGLTRSARSTALFIHQNNDNVQCIWIDITHTTDCIDLVKPQRRNAHLWHLHSYWTQLFFFFHKEKQEIDHVIQMPSIKLRVFIIQRLKQRNLITIYNIDCLGVVWKHLYLTRCPSSNTVSTNSFGWPKSLTETEAFN